MDELIVDRYPRDRAVAIIGGLVLLAVGAWLWVSAPAATPAPDFMSARDDQLVWAKGFLASGLLALLLGGASALADKREVASDRLATMGFAVVAIATAGASAGYVAFYL